jgi:hypothetical protein
MKAKRFLDLAAASRSLLFAWATRALVVLRVSQETEPK